MEMETTSEHTNRKLPRPDILKSFTILVEGKDDERIKATHKLLEHLREQQSDVEKGLSGDIQYSVNRLVQGLSSDRKYARIGYSTTLCQLLRSEDLLDMKYILTRIDEKANSQLTANASKSDERNVALGKAFGLLSLINSGKILSSTAGEISQTVQELLGLYGKKTYMQLVCMNGVIQIITRVSHDVFKQSVLPHIKNQLTSGWEECSPDTFHLILVTSQHHPSLMKKLLKEHWSDDQIVSEKNFPQIADIVSRCASHTHVIHPLIDELLDIVRQKHLPVGKFWNQVCRQLLIFERRVRGIGKHILGLYMLEKILPGLDSTKKLQEVMQPDMTGAVIKLCNKKTEDGMKKAVKTGDINHRASSVIQGLTALACDSTDAQYQLAMLKCLIKPPASYQIDSLTNTNCVAKLSSRLLPEAGSEYVEELMKGFTGQSSWIVSETESQSVLQWCVKQLCFVGSFTESSRQLSILKFLFLHSFFTVKNTNTDLPHCTVLDTDLTEFQRKCASDSFFKMLCKLLTKHDIGVPKATNLNQHIDLLYQLGEYVQQLLQAPHCIQLVKIEYQSEIVDEWDILAGVISTINNKRKSEEIIDSHAFELLFIYVGLQMFLDPQNAHESLQDLYVCYKKSTRRRKSYAKDDGPAWIDVITEVLVSMMFKDNMSSRVVAKQVMSFLADHVTTSTVQLVVDALEQTSLDSEDGMLCVESEDESDNEMDSEDDNDNTKIDNDDDVDDDGDSSSNDDDDDDDDSSDDSGIEEEKDVVVGDRLKEKIKVALGDAAGDSEKEDDDDDDDVEFSDTEMFKLDNVLASAFRSMSWSKKIDKQKTKQLLDFKTRVLDLAEAVVKSHATPSVTKDFILPLLSLVERGMRRGNEERLGNKAQATLHMIFKQKKVRTDADIDKDELFELLEQLMKCSNKVPVPSFIQDAGNACLFIMKILLGDCGISPLKTRSKSEHNRKTPAYYQGKVEDMMRSAILDLLAHKPAHCQPAFFHMLIVKYPSMLWSVHEDLTNTVSSDTAKIFDRTQAAAFLANMISKELLESVEAGSWSNFIDSWKCTASAVIGEMSLNEKFKKNLFEEVVATCHQIETTAPGQLVLDDGDLEHLVELHRKCDKPIKKAINKLTRTLKSTTLADRNKTEVKKNKKRKKNNKDETDDQSILKKMKVQGQCIPQRSEDKSQEEESSAGQSGNITTSKDKKKKKRKSINGNQSALKNTEMMPQSVVNGDVNVSSRNEPMNTSVANVKELESPKPSKNENISTPKSSRKKKRKSAAFDNSRVVNHENTGKVAAISTPNKARLMSENGSPSAAGTSSLQETVALSASASKKKKKKSKSMGSSLNESPSVVAQSPSVVAQSPTVVAQSPSIGGHSGKKRKNKGKLT